MWWFRLTSLLFMLPFVMFAKLADLYNTPDALFFLLYSALSTLCVGTSALLWWLGGSNEGRAE